MQTYTFTWEYRSGVFDLPNNRYPCIDSGQCVFVCDDATLITYSGRTFECDGGEDHDFIIVVH